jgi:hypothetical protein
MSWGPNENLDMWNKKEVYQDRAYLSYGKQYDLDIRLKDGKWSWKEIDRDKNETVSYDKFDTFLEAIENYEVRAQ